MTIDIEAIPQLTDQELDDAIQYADESWFWPEGGEKATTHDVLLDLQATRAEVERLTAERDRWRRVAEYGWHLHNYGENAPGGTETWREFEQLIRAAAAF